MTTSKTAIWIDDNPGRKSTAKDIGATFIDVHQKEIAPQIEKLFKGPRPALVILDHILDKTAPSNRLFQRGSTIAEAIKEKWPSCPVVGVTNANAVRDIDLRTKEAYDAVFPFDDLGKHVDRIEGIRSGFALVGRAKARSVRKLIDLLKPPDDEIERLVAALPDDLKRSFSDAGTASRLFRWIELLMTRPGFLYDSVWVAMILGLNDSGFQKVADDFEKAKYAGVFVRGDDPRWWSSWLTELLFKKSEPKSGEMTWHAGRRLPGIKEQHWSHCFVCGNEFPETVAHLDSESNERRAMHLKCTMLHPHHKRELFFDDIRMMRGN